MIIDLSLPIKNNTPEPDSPEIKYLNHVQGAKHLIEGAMEIVKKLEIKIPDLTEKDFPDGMGLANEEIVLDAHSGTHLDAPWHFGPKAGSGEAITIDKVPLEWCYSDGVVLDLRHKKAGELITEENIKEALRKINYEIKPYDIVLIMTGADKYFDNDNYFSAHPGMSSEATVYILNKGIKIIGIDAWGFDKPAMNMLEDYLKTRNSSCLFPAHFVGRNIEYCHIEKLVNLDKIPKSSGFKVACFPVKIENASAGWCRVVAIL